MKHFEQLKPFLTGEDPGIAYARLTADLGMSEGAVVAIIGCAGGLPSRCARKSRERWHHRNRLRRRSDIS
jgi:hypothetical protein